MYYNVDDDDVNVDDDHDDDDGADDDDDDVRACAVELHMNISQEPFCIKCYRENGRGHLRGQRFVRACAIEMHMDISQEPFSCAEIFRETAGRDGYHVDQPAGPNTYHKNLPVWPHCLENKTKFIILIKNKSSGVHF